MATKIMPRSTETLKHKPSKKVVLEEVLASLQDLVNNEFHDESANQAEPVDATENTPNVLSKPATPRKRGRPRKHPLPEPAAKVEKAAPESADYTYSQEQADMFGEPIPGKPKRGRVATPPARKQASSPLPARRIHRERQEPKLETTPKPATLRGVYNRKPDPVPDKPEKDMPNKSSNAASSELNLADEIPVLTEVVDPRELNMDTLQDVVDQSLARKDLAPEAREIAVKVAAKLNIEARKEGGEQLDVKTIMRLQALLKEALEPKV